MQGAFLKGDASYDGIFFTGVKTTRIFCRPSCAARKPLPENLEFFATPRDALVAGYRPCQRCHPLDADGRPPEWVEQLLASVEAAPAGRLTAADIQSLGIDPARARRYFLKNFGMTFNAYCRSQRLGQALEKIRQGADLDDVALDHGYESNSALVPGCHPDLERLKDELARYFKAELKQFTVPLVFPGTPFQQRVWEALLRIPYGETRSYEDIAREVGSPGAVRAVGRANGMNRVAIVIPCHRVVNKSVALGGYGGGLWRKQFLLNLERFIQR